jgi:glycine betaine/proline transport system substrate-binding protein
MRVSDKLRILGASAVILGALGAGPAAAQAESQDPIKITLHDWTGQLVTSTILGEVLKKAGYNV